MDGRLVRAALTFGVVGSGLMFAPGVVLIAGLVAVTVKSIAFVLSLLRPNGRSQAVLTRAGLGAGLLVWPLAYHVDLDATRGSGSEARALNIIRSVQAAEALYSAAHGYYDSLECLVQGSCMPNMPYPSRFLSPDVLRATQASGYRFLYFSGPMAHARSEEVISASGVDAYALVALPLDTSRSDRRAFCGDATRSVYATPSGRTPRVVDGRCIDTAERLP